MASMKKSTLAVLIGIFFAVHLTEGAAFEVVEATVADIQAAFKTGSLNATTLVQLYLDRIALFNPILKCVLEVNPDALAIAAKKDAERKAAGGFIGGLHGIPVLLKDNIATKDKLNTTAGSFALLYSIVPKDANLLTRLRKSGAIILGKASLSQWANFRSSNSISGWSSLGGFTIGPYNLQVNPSGSSSGSAVCAAANLAALTLGSETDGSIISPSDVNSVVGIKPTIGLVSRAGVIPISHSQDTVGPICRTVTDAVALLNDIVVTAYDPDDSATKTCLSKIPSGGYSKYLNAALVKGKRIGIPRNPFWSQTEGYVTSYQAPVYEKDVKILKSLGAIIVDNITLDVDLGRLFESELTILLTDFKQDLNDYLSKLVYAPSGRTLADLIQFNLHDPRERIDKFDQSRWISAENTTGFHSKEYVAAKLAVQNFTSNVFKATFKKLKLDAFIAPTPLGAGSLSAVAGYPIITVPAGYAPRNNKDGVPESQPYGLGFYGLACSEPVLISLAFAFEQATKVRQPPQFKGSLPSYVF